MSDVQRVHVSRLWKGVPVQDLLTGDRTPKWQGDLRVLCQGQDGHPLLYLCPGTVFCFCWARMPSRGKRRGPFGLGDTNRNMQKLDQFSSRHEPHHGGKYFACAWCLPSKACSLIFSSLGYVSMRGASCWPLIIVILNIHTCLAHEATRKTEAHLTSFKQCNAHLHVCSEKETDPKQGYRTHISLLENWRFE